MSRLGRFVRRALEVLPSYALFGVLVLFLPFVQLALIVVTFAFDRDRRLPGRIARLSAGWVGQSCRCWSLRIEGQWPERPGPFVVVANHESALDVLLLARLPHEVKWLAKASLFRVPWFGWILRLAGDIAVVRSDASSRQKALCRAERYLRRGTNVLIFPEGTRAQAALQPFRSGAFRLAIQTGCPVLPVAIAGTAAGLPKGSPWVRPTRAVARLLPPREVAGLGLEDVHGLRDEVQVEIRNARSALQAGLADAAAAGRPEISEGP